MLSCRLPGKKQQKKTLAWQFHLKCPLICYMPHPLFCMKFTYWNVIGCFGLWCNNTNLLVLNTSVDFPTRCLAPFLFSCRVLSVTLETCFRYGDAQKFVCPQDKGRKNNRFFYYYKSKITKIVSWSMLLYKILNWCNALPNETDEMMNTRVIYGQKCPRSVFLLNKNN